MPKQTPSAPQQDPLQLRIIRGYELLKKEKRYSQVTIVKKLAVLGYEVSPPSFSLAVRGKAVGNEVLTTTSEGITQLIRHELGGHWAGDNFECQAGDDWQENIIPVAEKTPDPKKGFILHDLGRLPISQKVDFFSVAQKQVMEIGITLNTFSNYFFTRNEFEFKIPIMKLLEKGVDFNCYLLNPDHHEASLYFNDRARVMPEERQGIEKIKASIGRLEKIAAFFAKEKLAGKFRVYTYRHIPHNYFLLIDPGSPGGKMMISHYIYGQLRAQCPVLEIHRKQNTSLYRRYWESARHFTQGAKLLNF